MLQVIRGCFAPGFTILLFLVLVQFVLGVCVSDLLALVAVSVRLCGVGLGSVSSHEGSKQV